MTSLDPNDPEGLIFLRALRAYSDECQPPELVYDCPFSYTIEPGVRGCGEECLDILASHNAPPRDRIVPVGDGLEFRRRRKARRGPAANARAFDASELHMAEDGNPDLGTWNGVALVVELHRLLTKPPPPDEVAGTERHGQARAVLDELESRGFDPDRLVRHGFGAALASSILVGVLIAHNSSLADDLGAAVLNETLAASWTAWLLGGERIELPADATPNQYGYILMSRIDPSAFLGWIQHASIDDLISWQPADVAPGTDLRDEMYDWLVERLTMTYLHTWSETSLRHEWRYLHGEEACPFPRNLIELRRVPKHLVSDELAERSVRRDPAARSRNHTGGDYVPAALKMLREGRRSSAAAIFEAVLQVEPKDASARNNFGFCLLPDDPTRALEEFDRALELGYDGMLTRANRLLALLLADRATTATHEVEVLLDALEAADPSPSWMWDIEKTVSGNAVVVEVPDCRLYAADLVEYIAATWAAPSEAGVWVERCSSLRERWRR